MIEQCKSVASTLGANERIKNLDPLEVANNLDKSRYAMKQYAVEAERWKAPKNVDPLKAEYSKLLQAFDNCIFLAKDVLECAKEAKLDQQGAAIGAKKNWHNQRDKIVSFVQKEGAGICDALARVIADALYSLAVSPETVGLQPVLHDLELVLGPLATVATFARVCVLTQPPDGASQEERDTKTYLHRALADFAKGHLVSIKAKAKICEDDMAATKGPQSMCTMDVAGHDLGWNDTAHVDWFTPIGVVKHLIFRKLCMFFDYSIASFPFRLHPMIITMYSGRAVVACVPETDAVRNNSDFPGWLARLHCNAFAKNEACILEEGDSIWLPLGTVGLIVGIPTGVDWTAETPKLAPRGKPKPKSKKLATAKPMPNTDEAIVYGIHLYYSTAAASAPLDVRLAIRANWVLGAPTMSKAVSANQNVVKWKKCLGDDESEA